MVVVICGSADTFFTPVFAAQGKRQLSTYRNAEIKSLLADLLGQDEIRALGQKAGETARLLKAGLLTIRQELAAVDTEVERVATEQRALDGAEGCAALSLTARHSAQAALEAARMQHAQWMALRQQSQGIEVRRGELQRECDDVVRAGTQAIEALGAQEQGEQQRLDRLQQRITQRVTLVQNRRQTLQGQRKQCLEILASEPAVRRAAHRLPLAEQVLVARTSQVDLSRQMLQRLTRCQGMHLAAEHKLAAIEREAGQAVLRAEELAQRFGLQGKFPASGATCRAVASCLAMPGKRRS